MKIIILVFSSFLLTGSVLGQKHFGDIKDSLLDLEHVNGKKAEAIVQNIYLLSEKGLDSIDIAMLLDGNFLGMIVMKIANSEKPLTYGAVYEEFEQFKTSGFYHSVRNGFLESAELKRLKAVNSNWTRVAEILKNQDTRDEEIEEVYHYFEQHQDSTRNFYEVLRSYKNDLELKKSENKRKLLTTETGLVFDAKYLQQSQEQNKPILLYFTGFGCVNCRKMEQTTLNDDVVFNLVTDHFIFLPLYVDSKAELPESEQVYSETLRKTMTTIGEKNAALEIEEYNTASQPLFVCLNGKGVIVGTTDYAKSSKYPFEDFLRDCLKKVNNE